MSTIMVIGATGFLGSNIVLHLRKKHKVIALFRRQVIRYEGVNTFHYSFDDIDYMKRLMAILKPGIIIYASGVNDLMECHLKPQLADAANSLGPVFFLDAAHAVPHRYIYLSTSYIFDGRKGSYQESDLPMTETTFGKSKLAGENYVRSKAQSYTVFRCSPVYGMGSTLHPSFTDRLRNDLAAGKRHELPENENHSFLYIDTLLESLDWVIQNESKNEVYHLAGLTKLSTYEFGVEFAQKFGFDPKLVVPNRGIFKDSSFLDFSLNASRFVKASQINPLVLEKGFDLLQKKLIL